MYLARRHVSSVRIMNTASAYAPFRVQFEYGHGTQHVAMPEDLQQELGLCVERNVQGTGFSSNCMLIDKICGPTMRSVGTGF